MRKRFQIAVAVLLVILAGVIAWQVLRLRQPVYQEKLLSVWLASGRSDDLYFQAIRQFGTNALPVLIERVQARDTPLKQLMKTWAEKQTFIHYHFKSAAERRGETFFGYVALGPLAASQVPRLIDILTSDRSPEIRRCAAAALCGIGPEARLAAPALIHATKDTDASVRAVAFSALGEILPDPRLTIPVLVAGLDDPYSDARAMAAEALSHYGPVGKAAVPALQRMVERNYDALFGPGPDDALSFQKRVECIVAGTALKQIDPEGAAKVLGDSVTNARFGALHFWRNAPDESTGRAATNALKQIAPKAAAKAGVK